MTDTVTVSFSADTRNVALARTVAAAVAARADFPLDRLEDLRLAVDEAVTQVIACASSDVTCIFTEGDHAIEVEVHGNGEIVHRLEGRDVLRYSHAQYDTNDADGRRLAEAAGNVQIDRGTISIQSESFPIQFRSIAVRPLEPR